MMSRSSSGSLKQERRSVSVPQPPNDPKSEEGSASPALYIKDEDRNSMAISRSPSPSTAASAAQRLVRDEPSHSPSSNMDDIPPLKTDKMSATPSPPPSFTMNGTESKSSTPASLPPPTPSTSSRKRPPVVHQLIDHLPVARIEALSTFIEMGDNWYQYKSLGRSRELNESMTCDCTYEHGVDSPDDACGYHSDCINRLTQVECLEEDCRCRSYCQNQRFRKKEYAPIDIVKTEMKGYGLRAEEDILKDTFIYEYIGDVVSNSSFKKRMRDYAAEGIEHFYFMMLQKDEFIDATKNGGIGRFANHSCNPNCYVAKWTVGNLVRMGIFAKRKIVKHEELTFNYNVDRYGHQAQICYCGEPNCVGFIGGKTQTDISTMDDLYLDALGITDEADLLELKGTKKKKGKKLDDPDFMPIMKPIVEKEVPKVVQAIRQTQSKKVLFKLLTRVKITEDQAALRQIMRLRGYSLMKNILEDYADNIELLILALNCMFDWPLVFRNKVEDSQIINTVTTCAASEDETIKTPAQKLLDHWESLTLGYRIPKRQRNLEEPSTFIVTPLYDVEEVKEPENKRSKYMREFVPMSYVPPPPQPIARLYRPPTPEPVINYRETIWQNAVARENKASALIAAATRTAAAEAAAALEASKAAAEAAAKEKADREAKIARRKERAARPTETAQEREANKEKRLLKLIGAVVMKCMSEARASKVLGHDLFKEHAKELTQLIADREKKSSSYKDAKLSSLSDEKTAKIRKFAKGWIERTLHKLKKSGYRKPASSSATVQAAAASTSANTPNSADGVQEQLTEGEMDMDPESESDVEDGDVQVDPEPMEDHDPGEGAALPNAVESAPSDAPMDVDVAPVSHQAADPRRRPPDDSEIG